MRRLPQCALLAFLAASCTQADRPEPKLTYPTPHQGDVVEDYHGTKIADPYRWMEDLDAKETADWVAASNAVTEPYLAQLPLRQRFNQRLTELWNYSRVGVPSVRNGELFYSANTGLQRQSPVFVREDPGSEPRLVLDPNAISEDGALSLAQYEASPDATLLAYAIAEGGADWRTVKVRDVARGQDLPDAVNWVRFSDVSWTRDSKGFYYSRYPEPPKNKVLEAALAGQALYYHVVGTPQSSDILVHERKDLARWLVGGTVTEDGRYLLVMMSPGSGRRNRLYFADLGSPMKPNLRAAVRPVVEADDAEYWPIGSSGSLVYVRSDKDAPNGKVVAVNLKNPAPAAWRTIVAEKKEAIESVDVIAGRVVVHYLVNVQSRLALFGLDGSSQGEVALPGPGAVGFMTGREEGSGIWYNFSSPLAPSTVYRYDLAARESRAFDAPVTPVDIAPFETNVMFATSKDGTRVPFFLTAKKGLPRNGNNPTMIYGYGGFSVSTLPTYRQDVPAWLEMGGIWVSVNMRGGAEYGEAWHVAGRLENKQNVFDDFIAVAEHLIAQKYTSPAKLGMMGASNGGLLVGAVMEQRPDLFAVALPAVGVMDMLRYDRFTGGALWAPEYGSASSPSQFPFLIKYSPVHNVKAGTCYPATLITTADHDDRVVPSHSFKFTATLQAAQGCRKPVLIRVEVQGSHGYRPTDKLIAERADQWAFAAANMGVK